MSAATTRRGDALVVFGITGDLARKMTLRSLYRLDARDMLDCPIIGVAVDDWTDEHLREHALDAVKATGEPIDDAVWWPRRWETPATPSSTSRSRRRCLRR
jgi:glucose-6-phosphate 1-dehydrogenase